MNKYSIKKAGAKHRQYKYMSRVDNIHIFTTNINGVYNTNNIGTIS